VLPFSREQFLAVFAAYNQAIWPAQLVAYLLGAAAVAALFRPGERSNRLIAGVLAIMWLWSGIGYHVIFFAAINPAAYAFGALFVLQALLFASMAVGRHQPHFGYSGGVAGWLGVALIAYAATLYPIVGWWAGHAYPEMPLFGVTPCPVTLFTFGALLLTTSRVPGWVLVIPGLWSLIGGTAAFLLHVPQDWVLLFSGLISFPILILRARHRLAIAPASSE